MNKVLPKLINISVKERYSSLILTLLTLICLGACTPKHSSYSDFKDVGSDGWLKTEACEFVPSYGDSLGVYDVEISFYFVHNYPYRNINAVVDFVKGDSLVCRAMIEKMITDESGNWQTAGFGVQYQSIHDVKCGVRPGDFDKIQVWQGLNCDTLRGITKVGVLVTPARNR